jgi:hypothetical protein
VAPYTSKTAHLITPGPRKDGASAGQHEIYGYTAPNAGIVCEDGIRRSNKIRKRVEERLEMQKNQQIEQMRERLTRNGQKLERVRRQLADKNQRVRLMNEQQRTSREEAARLDTLHQQRLSEKDAEITRLKRQLYESSSGTTPHVQESHTSFSEHGASELYLDLMKKCLTGWIYKDAGELHQRDAEPCEDLKREEGRDWPVNAHTMVGLKRLDNIQHCVEDVIRSNVPGDLIETGVWRGGASIFMRAILEAHGVGDRCVWAADSFEGMPPPDAENYPHDARFDKFAGALAVSLEQVQDNFDRYGLLDGQVRFLKGLFRDTLPAAPIEKLAVARLDGDWYESTMDGLVNLYPKLSVGGYLILDDYGCVPACRQAVHDYREAHGITEEIRSVDWTGVYWQRTR